MNDNFVHETEQVNWLDLIKSPNSIKNSVLKQNIS